MTVAFINTNARHNAKDTALSQNNETIVQKEKNRQKYLFNPRALSFSLFQLFFYLLQTSQ